MFNVSHQFIFRCLVKVTKNKKNSFPVCLLFFQLLKTSFNWEFFSFLTNLDEERRFMYKINQGHLTVFCIVFVWLGGPPSPVRIITQVPWFMYQNRLGPSGGIYYLHKRKGMLWLHPNRNAEFQTLIRFYCEKGDIKLVCF